MLGNQQPRSLHVARNLMESFIPNTNSYGVYLKSDAPILIHLCQEIQERLQTEYEQVITE